MDILLNDVELILCGKHLNLLQDRAATFHFMHTFYLSMSARIITPYASSDADFDVLANGVEPVIRGESAEPIPRPTTPASVTPTPTNPRSTTPTPQSYLHLLSIGSHFV